MNFSTIFWLIKIRITWPQHLKNLLDKLKHVTLRSHIFKVWNRLFMEQISSINFQNMEKSWTVGSVCKWAQSCKTSALISRLKMVKVFLAQIFQNVLEFDEIMKIRDLIGLNDLSAEAIGQFRACEQRLEDNVEFMNAYGSQIIYWLRNYDPNYPL